MDSRPDLSQNEIPRTLQTEDGGIRLNPAFPHSGECKAGHAWAPPRVTRFFHVTSTHLEENQEGVYCEHCLIISNKIKTLNKTNQPIDFDPDAEVAKLREAAWEEEQKRYGYFSR